MNPSLFEFASVEGRAVVASFDGGRITSDAGALLLGAAKYLAETRNFGGIVYLIFQPAEEGLGGGEIMVREGLFQRCPMEMVFGLHNWPQLPAGTFAWRHGPVMAAVANIAITITGKGAHGAMPH